MLLSLSFDTAEAYFLFFPSEFVPTDADNFAISCFVASSRVGEKISTPTFGSPASFVLSLVRVLSNVGVTLIVSGLSVERDNVPSFILTSGGDDWFILLTVSNDCCNIDDIKLSSSLKTGSCVAMLSAFSSDKGILSIVVGVADIIAIDEVLFSDSVIRLFSRSIGEDKAIEALIGFVDNNSDTVLSSSGNFVDDISVTDFSSTCTG